MGGPKSDCRNRGAAGDGFLGEQSRAAAIQNKQSREAAKRMLAWGVSPRNQIPTRTEPRSGDTEYMLKSTDRTVVPPIKRFCSARNAQSVGSAGRGIGRTIPVGLMLCRRYAALFLRNSCSWGSRPRLTFCRRHAACSGGDACSQGLRPRLTFSSPLRGLFALIAASETRREWFLKSDVMGTQNLISETGIPSSEPPAQSHRRSHKGMGQT